MSAPAETAVTAASAAATTARRPDYDRGLLEGRPRPDLGVGLLGRLILGLVLLLFLIIAPAVGARVGVARALSPVVRSRALTGVVRTGRAMRRTGALTGVVRTGRAMRRTGALTGVMRPRRLVR